MYLEAPVPPVALPGQPSLSDFEASFGDPDGGELEGVPPAPRLMEGSQLPVVAGQTMENSMPLSNKVFNTDACSVG